ncbi:MAG: hypothetical protein E7317_03100 [Clostridiales bacterium]|nr:hypothetical protein [Clostridiales bacterium]
MREPCAVTARRLTTQSNCFRMDASPMYTSDAPSEENAMPTIAAVTLGCKVNQYDTEAMLEAFEAAGYEVVPFERDADVYLVNTCTVTVPATRRASRPCAARRAATPTAP